MTTIASSKISKTIAFILDEVEFAEINPDDSRMIKLLLGLEEFESLSLVDGIYEASFCSAKIHTEFCGPVHSVQDRDVGTAVSHAFLLAHGVTVE